MRSHAKNLTADWTKPIAVRDILGLESWLALRVSQTYRPNVDGISSIRSSCVEIGRLYRL
jgi:hypothetical protein